MLILVDPGPLPGDRHHPPEIRLPEGADRGRPGQGTRALLEGSWPTKALLAHIALAKHSEHMPLNRQAIVMARLGVPIDRSVLADWVKTGPAGIDPSSGRIEGMNARSAGGRTGALIAPVVDRMACC